MTICIAGVCKDKNGEQVLALCADTRVTISGFASSDMGEKLEIAGSVPVLVADSAARAKEVVAVIARHLKEFSDDSILGKLKEVAKIRKRELLDEYFNLTWGIDYSGYLSGSLNHLPADVASRIARDVEQVNFDCQLIIAPRTEKGFRIFTMDSHGTVLEANGFATIGSGSWIAQASLYQRQYSRHYSLPRAAYFIYEAKRLAENEPTVGKATNMWLIHYKFGGGVAFLNGVPLRTLPSGEAALGPDVFEKLFRIYSPQPVPGDFEMPELVWPNSSPEVPPLEKP